MGRKFLQVNVNSAQPYTNGWSWTGLIKAHQTKLFAEYELVLGAAIWGRARSLVKHVGSWTS